MRVPTGVPGKGFGVRFQVGGGGGAFPLESKGEGDGDGEWGGGVGVGTGKGTGKSMRKLCRNYPLAKLPFSFSPIIASLLELDTGCRLLA